MSGSDPLREATAALSRFFVGGASVAETLQRVNDLAAVAVPPAAMSGITLMLEGKATTAVFSDEAAPVMDEAQYASGRGPCLHAFRTNQVVLLPDTHHEPRWPEFSEVAAEHGVRSVLSVPLVLDDVGIGALNMYSREASAFGEEDAAAGRAFAAHASVVLANANAYWDAHTLTQQLDEALRSRAVIEQAKGIIMAQSQVGPDEAFAILRRVSQRENRKLRDVAFELVSRYGQGREG